MNEGVLIAVAAAILGPLLTYVIASRRMSGKIATSDASELWKESASIRDDYRTQLLQANERVLSLEARMAKAEDRNAELSRENFDLRAKVTQLELLVETLRSTIARLETTIAEQRAALEGP